MKTLLLIAALAATSAGAQIANPMPSDVDLKAAYCMGAIEDKIAIYEGTQTAEDHKATLLRIRSYIVPKIQYLDATGLLAAKNSAKADMNAAIDFSLACVQSCKANDQCRIQCIAQNPAAARLNSCNGAPFLPF